MLTSTSVADRRNHFGIRIMKRSCCSSTGNATTRGVDARHCSNGWECRSSESIERLSRSMHVLTGHDPSRSPLLVVARYMLRMFTARAATSPTVRKDAIDSISIRLLMRTLSGIASVGLNALALVNAT